jgi:catechol 2,3-dioxygenase-like lactoylglutathione lyase family enzyme
MKSGPSVRTQGLLESALYVEDLDRSAVFYTGLFDFKQLVRDDRLCALSIEGRQVLLLFKRGASVRPGFTPGGTIPPHDGEGKIHLAFAIRSEDLDRWEQRLSEFGVSVESRVHWPEGGTSIYFRDPDMHSVELATPGTWTIY